MQSLGAVVRQKMERIVVENEMLKAGFAAVPYVILRNNKLSIGARMAYIVLLSYAWQDDSTFVGQAKMAEDMGISGRQLQRYLYELRDGGHIEISREDRRYHNTYIIKDVKTKLKAKKRARHDMGVVSDATSLSYRK